MAHVIIEKYKYGEHTTHLIDLERFLEIIFKYEDKQLIIVTPGERINLNKSNYDEETKQLTVLASICRKEFTFQSIEQLQEYFYEELKK
ncbi:MAG: hypothetical protein ACRCW9_06020 [Cetobacterium sp.]